MFDLVPISSRRSIVTWEQTWKDIVYPSLIFDSTSCLGEVLAVVVYFISTWTIQQALFVLSSWWKVWVVRRWHTLSVCFLSHSVQSHRLLVNTAAMCVVTVTVMYPNPLDRGCPSHIMLNRVKERFKAPTLSIFFTPWMLSFPNSPKVKALWRKLQVGLWLHTPKPGGGREVMNTSGDVKPFSGKKWGYWSCYWE